MARQEDPRFSPEADAPELLNSSSHAQTQKIREKLADLTQFLRDLRSAPQLTAIERWCRILGRVLVKFIDPKFSSWGKEVICQVVDVDPITVLGNFKNG